MDEIVIGTIEMTCDLCSKPVDSITMTAGAAGVTFDFACHGETMTIFAGFEWIHQSGGRLTGRAFVAERITH